MLILLEIRMKYNIKVMIEKQYIKDSYRNINIMLIFTPKNVFFKLFSNKWYQDFSIRNNIKESKIELSSQMDFKKNKLIDKNEIESAYENGENFIINLKNSNINIPLERNIIKYLLNKEITKKESENKSAFVFEFEDTIEKLSNKECKIEEYVVLKKENDMNDIFPL